MDKKKLGVIGGIAAVVVIAVIITVVAVNSGKGNTDDKGGDKGGSSQQDKKDGDGDKKSGTITADDLKNVDVTIAYGDYEAMESLSKKIQNGEMDGKVVKIDGKVSNFSKGMSYNIGERRENGNAFIGTTFTIEDGAEDDYPSDGDQVVITGIVKADDSGLVHTIKTLKAFVEKK
jgi:hypothetical protein